METPRSNVSDRSGPSSTTTPHPTVRGFCGRKAPCFLPSPLLHSRAGAISMLLERKPPPDCRKKEFQSEQGPSAAYMLAEKHMSSPTSENTIGRTSWALPRSDGQGLEKLPRITDTRSDTEEKTRNTYQYGVAFIARKEVVGSVISCTSISSKLMSIRIFARPHNVTIIQVYATILDNDDKELLRAA